MNTHEQIVRAISAHGMWKARLNDAIETGKSEFSVATVVTDDHCDFGKWLKGATLELKNNPHYKKCVELHSQFHKQAADVLSLAIAGKKEEATKATGLGSPFSSATSALVKELMAWDREVS